MKLIDKLIEDIFVDEYFRAIYQKCFHIFSLHNLNQETIVKLSEKELNDVLRYADILSVSDIPKARNTAYNLITFLYPDYREYPVFKTISKAIYSKLGNFPAISYLEKNNNDAKLPFERGVQNEAKKIIQKVPGSDFVFTDSQYELFEKLKNTIEYSFSGPTSMGKSFMIKAFIKMIMRNNPPENLVLIVPTRALINQFTIDLKNEMSGLLEQFNYRIITNSNVTEIKSDKPHNYIFVLTPERFISYMSIIGNPPIGFIFVDEAHKLANDKDSRSVTTYTAIEKALNKYGNIKLYFASPNVSNPEIFLKLFNRKSLDNYYSTSESPVSQNLFFIDMVNKSVESYSRDFKINIDSDLLQKKELSVIDLVLRLGEGKNNLIYCNSKVKTIEKANDFIKSLKPIEQSIEIKRAISQIKNYIHPDYYLADFLRFGTAYHYGKLPQIIRNLVEDLYRNEKVTNIFCTSTLLEGVNMPTQNIFIVDNKNGLKKLSQIDFWNLSGRAGRLSKELSGNIYCINHNDCEWENKEILIKEDIVLNPTVLNKVDKNLKRIEKILNDQDISGTEEEKFILKYIANIISVDTLELDSNYKSPIILKLIDKNKNEIIELAKNKVKDYIIPKHILSSNQSISLKIQNSVFKILQKNNKIGNEIRLPNGKINYEVCLDLLRRMHKLYEWENEESKLKNTNSLKYYAFLANQWINGISLSQMINQSIDYHKDNKISVSVSYDVFEQFSINNKKHINIVIEKLIDDIDYILRFLLEKYFNHYYQILVEILGEDEAGENWASLLEYGTQNRIVIALQNLGLSRTTSLKIFKDSLSALEIKEGKLVDLNKELILKNLRRESLEYEEVLKVL